MTLGENEIYQDTRSTGNFAYDLDLSYLANSVIVNLQFDFIPN
jgi:hypothetical protein